MTDINKKITVNREVEKEQKNKFVIIKYLGSHQIYD